MSSDAAQPSGHRGARDQPLGEVRAAATPRTTVVVDAANCVGSVPDGWWRDRAGATKRLRDGISPEALRRALHLEVTPQVVMVVEGQARGVQATEVVGVVEARGSGDDTIVDVTEQSTTGGADVVVVTADRGLRSRVEFFGARTVGPRIVRPG